MCYETLNEINKRINLWKKNLSRRHFTRATVIIIVKIQRVDENRARIVVSSKSVADTSVRDERAIIDRGSNIYSRYAVGGVAFP